MQFPNDWYSAANLENKLLECANVLPLNTPMGNAPSSATADPDDFMKMRSAHPSGKSASNFIEQ